MIDDLIDKPPAKKKGRDDRSRKRKKRTRPKVFGDAAYDSGDFQGVLEANDIESGGKTQAPSPPPGGLFAKDRFTIDLDAQTVTCPNDVTVTFSGRRTDGTSPTSPTTARRSRSARTKRSSLEPELDTPTPVWSDWYTHCRL